MSVTDDEEILLAFCEESWDNLHQMDRDLVELETRGADKELLGRVFRAVHTLKGTCGFLGFTRLESLAHAAEDLLSSLREGTLLIDAASATSLLRLVDAVRAVLTEIEATSHEPPTDHEPLITELRSYLLAPLAEPAPVLGPPAAPPAEPAPVLGPPAAPPAAPLAVPPAVPLAEPVPSTAPPAVPLTAPPAAPVAAPPAVPLAAPPTVPLAEPAPSTAPSTAPVAELQAPPTGDTTVRVDVAVLDRLMDLVGELVLARGRIGELAALDEEGPLAAPYRDLRMLTGDLQDSVMTARLQPIGTVTGKVPRIARDLATALGKQVVVHIEGEGVGVDKAVNEALRDPLLHLVRNCLDHGIETPEQRLAAGKPATGTLSIRAFHEGGRVHVEVADDGSGVDLSALGAKAVSQGVVSSEAVLELSEAQVLDLVFHPGLSTRDEVTSTSGRGVGMDVVRSSVERVGGSVHVASTPGEGVVFRLNVPLTLAIMPVLVASCGGGRYAIPQVDLHEVMQLDLEQVDTRVDTVGTSRMLRLRGRLLPLVDLAEHLEVTGTRTDGLVVVVVETDGRRFGIVVDEVADTVDAVVKPLPALLRGLTVFAGTTILGDGRPTLVIDVAGIAASARVSSAGLSGPDGASAPPSASAVSDLLLATASDGGLVVLPVSRVRRLESFAVDRLEWSGSAMVVQYGTELLPVARIEDLLPERRRAGTRAATGPATGTHLETVVCESSAGPIGLVVASIDDVVAEPAALRQPASRAGVSACLVVEGRVAELLDVDVLAERAAVGPVSGGWHDVDDRIR